MITSDVLTADGIAHGFFTREGGYSSGIFASLNCGMGSGDDKETVRRNRTVVAAALAVEEPQLVTAHQVHSAEALVIDAPFDILNRPKVDALVTSRPGIAIAVLTADCGPILFADCEAGVIAVAHAGWKGALTGVTASTLDRMEEQGAKRSRTVAVIGPMISQAAYEVGPEFPARFTDSDRANSAYFAPSPRAGHTMFDLPRYIEDRLRREGAGRVVNLALCTFNDESRFFSYRRTTHRNEKDYGRQISAIALCKE